MPKINKCQEIISESKKTIKFTFKWKHLIAGPNCPTQRLSSLGKNLSTIGT